MKKILLAYDGTDPSERALDLAARLAHAFAARLDVVCVVPSRPGAYPIDAWFESEARAQCLERARVRLEAQGIEASLHEPMGDPATMIEVTAERGGYDAIVVGTRGDDAVGRVIDGSVSEHVAGHAAATVVVAR